MTSLVLALFFAAAPTVSVSGSVLTPDGQGVSSGTITARLITSGSVVDNGVSARVASESSRTISAGGALSAWTLVPNDVITPAGGYYVVAYSVVTKSGRRAAWTENWQLASSPASIDIGSVPKKASTGSAVDPAASILPAVAAAQAASKAYTDQAVAALAATGTPAASNGTGVSVTTSGAYNARTLAAELGDTFKPERFGCAGDGTTDDYDCWQRTVAAVNSAGGGVIELKPKATYRINRYRIIAGAQANGVTNFTFANLTGLVIRGNGARVDFKGDYVRSWDFTGGAPDFYHGSYREPVGFEFRWVDGLSISDLEIDGNSDSTTKATGITEGNCHGLMMAAVTRVRLDNLWVHHWPADGMIIRDSGGASATISKHVTVTNSRFEYNGRQAVSLTGARWITFINSQFLHTGRVASYGYHPPAGGMDLEPDRWPGASAIGYPEADDYSGDLTFIGGIFQDNLGSEFVGGQARRRNSGATLTIDGPVRYPITFVGTQFRGSAEGGGRVVSTGTVNTFTGCIFRDVAFMPAYASDGPQGERTTVTGSFFENSIPGIHVFRWGPTDGELVVRDSVVRAVAPSQATVIRWLVQPTGTAQFWFSNNTVFIDSREHTGTGRISLHLGTTTTGELDGNTWTTDLSAAGAFWQVAAATHKRERYASAGKFSATTSIYSGATYSGGAGVVSTAAARADVASTPTAAEFNDLLAKLRAANVIAP